MTWLGDPNSKLPEADRVKLLEQRVKIVKQIEKLSMQPLASKSQASAQGRQEDLLALAKKIKIIDKKLGRES